MKREQAGFALIDTLLAVFLLGVVILSAAGLFVQALKFGGASKDLGSSGACAALTMESLRAQSFDSLTAGGNLGSNVGGYSDVSNPTCTVRWTITDDASPARVKTITVRSMARRRVMGLEKEVMLMTLRSI